MLGSACGGPRQRGAQDIPSYELQSILWIVGRTVYRVDIMGRTKALV